jgi:hypothetical protein
MEISLLLYLAEGTRVNPGGEGRTNLFVNHHASLNPGVNYIVKGNVMFVQFCTIVVLKLYRENSSSSLEQSNLFLV